MRANRNLTLFQRAVNRFGRPLGILPYSLAWLPDDSSAERAATFDDIFEKNIWQSAESVSGPGSEVARTRKYREDLVRYLKENQIRSMFDAPCGDLNWMGRVIDEVNIHYIGGDVSPNVVERAKSKFPELDIRHFDICTDEFPDVEVWHCRDTFLHLSFDDIWRALRNAARSDVQYALLTSHRGRLLQNVDVPTGGARPLDLQREPFNFPAPLKYLRDFSGWGFPRAVGVWRMDAIRSVIADRQAPAMDRVKQAGS